MSSAQIFHMKELKEELKLWKLKLNVVQETVEKLYQMQNVANNTEYLNEYIEIINGYITETKNDMNLSEEEKYKIISKYVKEIENKKKILVLHNDKYILELEQKYNNLPFDDVIMPFTERILEKIDAREEEAAYLNSTSYIYWTTFSKEEVEKDKLFLTYFHKFQGTSGFKFINIYMICETFWDAYTQYTNGNSGFIEEIIEDTKESDNDAQKIILSQFASIMYNNGDKDDNEVKRLFFSGLLYDLMVPKNDLMAMHFGLLTLIIGIIKKLELDIKNSTRHWMCDLVEVYEKRNVFKEDVEDFIFFDETPYDKFKQVQKIEEDAFISLIDMDIV